MITAHRGCAVISPKVLHIIESLDRGAVENWLVRMLAHGRRQGMELDWTFYCTLGREGALDEEVRALGGKVIHAPVQLSRKLAFARALRAELRAGAYDVLHGHHDLLNGVYLLAASGLPIRRRIVHAHNADENLLTPSPLKQLVYREPLRQTCLHMADRIVGISNHTLDTLLAGRTRQPGRDSVHYYGVDPTPFVAVAPDRDGFRRSIGVANDAQILLFGGRLTPEKNPIFTLDVLSELRRLAPRAIAVFAGAGAEDAGIISRAREMRLEDSVRLLGWRSDLPDVMACSDWFILPRPEAPMEGFGLAVVEAQLAGLHMLLSRGIPDDPLLPTASFCRLPLAAGPGEWARAAMALMDGPAPSRAAAVTALSNSPMDMDRALDALMELYR